MSRLAERGWILIGLLLACVLAGFILNSERPEPDGPAGAARGAGEAPAPALTVLDAASPGQRAPLTGSPAPSAHPVRQEAISPASHRVVLVDPSGRPAAGVGVALSRAPDAEDVSFRETDEKGRLAWAQSSEEPDQQLMLIAIAAPERIVVPHGSGTMKEGEWTVQVPHHGWLELECTDGDALETWLAVGTRGDLESEDDLRGHCVSARGSTGQALLRLAVEAGREDLDWLAGRRGSFTPIGGQVAPLAAGERRRLRVSFASAGPVLAARVVDASGAARPGVDLHARLHLVGGNQDQLGAAGSGSRRQTGREASRIQADAQGRFEIALPARWVGIGCHLELIEADTGAKASARAEPIILERGRQDLGDLELRPLPVLAGGHVTGASGPVPGAVVRLIVSLERSGSDETSLVSESTTGPEGEFTLRGWPPDGRGALEVRADGCEDFREEIEVPSSSLELRLRPALEVRGRLLVDAGLRALRVTSRPEGALVRSPLRGFPPEAPGERSVDAAPDGAFVFRNMRPGRYSVFVSIDPWSEPLIRVDGVEPRRADSGAPGNLVLDLRGLLLGMVVRARAPDGRLVADLRIFTRPLDAPVERPWGVPTFAGDGVARCAVAGLPVHLLVTSPGWRDWEQVVHQPEVLVQLEPAPALRLAFEPPLPPPPEGVRWRVFLHRGYGAGLLEPVSPEPLADDSLRFRPPASGRYELMFNLGGGARSIDQAQRIHLDLDLDRLPTTLTVAPPEYLAHWVADYNH